MSLTIFGVRKNAIVAVGLLYLLILSEKAQGAEYVVGDKLGWDLDPSIFHWPEGKNFNAGDVLIFNYKNPLFNVEAVDKTAYDRCFANGHPKKVYSSGHDRVVLEKGANYFICAVPDYCGYGMRIAINAQ